MQEKKLVKSVASVKNASLFYNVSIRNALKYQRYRNKKNFSNKGIKENWFNNNYLTLSM